jgi:hypothetical protein
MLAIKYLLAAAPAAAPYLLPVALPSLMRSMHEDDDDVRATAAHACVPMASHIIAQGPETVRALLAHLWEMLPLLGDLSAATESVLQLLSMLYSHQSDLHGSAKGTTSEAMMACGSTSERAWNGSGAAQQSVRAGLLNTPDEVTQVQVWCSNTHTLERLTRPPADCASIDIGTHKDDLDAK